MGQLARSLPGVIIVRVGPNPTEPPEAAARQGMLTLLGVSQWWMVILAGLGMKEWMF